VAKASLAYACYQPVPLIRSRAVVERFFLIKIFSNSRTALLKNRLREQQALHSLLKVPCAQCVATCTLAIRREVKFPPTKVAESEVFEWSRIPNNTGESESDFFVRLRLSSWIIFYITLLNCEFLLKWYNFFWNFCWNRVFLLYTTISIDFNSQIPFPLC